MRTWRFLVVCLLLAAGTAWAQEWKGKGKISGQVVDRAGKPIKDAVVTLTFGGQNAGPEPVKTKGNGEWEIKNIADGKWVVRIAKDGFDPQESPVDLGGAIKEPRLKAVLGPVGSSANAELVTGDQKARALIEQKQFAEARAIYQQLIAKYPQAARIHIMLAQTYDSEGKYSEAADELAKYAESDPKNIEIGMFLIAEYSKAGRGAEAFALMKQVPPDVLKDVRDIQDSGFALLRAKKPVEALQFFDLAAERFPAEASNHYYRGLSEMQIGSVVEKPGTPESRPHLDRAIEHLQKYLSVAPSGPDADNAKKMLEALKQQ